MNFDRYNLFIEIVCFKNFYCDQADELRDKELYASARCYYFQSLLCYLSISSICDKSEYYYDIYDSYSKCEEKLTEIKERLKSLENKGDKHTTFTVYLLQSIHQIV